jgi:hypothetical protein
MILYRPDGKPERSELDTDNDHAIDRWETLRADGTAMTVATSRRGRLAPDTWQHIGPDGFVFQTDYDDNGDGKVDRTDYAAAAPAKPAKP